MGVRYGRGLPRGRVDLQHRVAGAGCQNEAEDEAKAQAEAEVESAGPGAGVIRFHVPSSADHLPRVPSFQPVSLPSSQRSALRRSWAATGSSRLLAKA